MGLASTDDFNFYVDVILHARWRAQTALTPMGASVLAETFYFANYNDLEFLVLRADLFH